MNITWTVQLELMVPSFRIELPEAEYVTFTSKFAISAFIYPCRFVRSFTFAIHGADVSNVLVIGKLLSQVYPN
jgi:hypothetical protein